MTINETLDEWSNLPELKVGKVEIDHDAALALALLVIKSNNIGDFHKRLFVDAVDNNKDVSKVLGEIIISHYASQAIQAQMDVMNDLTSDESIKCSESKDMSIENKYTYCEQGRTTDSIIISILSQGSEIFVFECDDYSMIGNIIDAFNRAHACGFTEEQILQQINNSTADEMYGKIRQLFKPFI